MRSPIIQKRARPLSTLSTFDSSTAVHSAAMPPPTKPPHRGKSASAWLTPSQHAANECGAAIVQCQRCSFASPHCGSDPARMNRNAVSVSVERHSAIRAGQNALTRNLPWPAVRALFPPALPLPPAGVPQAGDLFSAAASQHAWHQVRVSQGADQ